MRNRVILTGLLLLWVVCFVGGFLHFERAEPTGDGFARGFNRVLLFCGWQAAAFILSIVVLLTNRREGTDMVSRLFYVAGYLPILGSGLLLIAFVGLVAYLAIVG